MTSDDILTLREAADMAGRSEEALRKACQRGTLRAKRVGGQTYRASWVTTRDDLAEYLARSRARALFPARDQGGRFRGSRVA